MHSNRSWGKREEGEDVWGDGACPPVTRYMCWSPAVLVMAEHLLTRGTLELISYFALLVHKAFALLLNCLYLN